MSIILPIICLHPLSHPLPFSNVPVRDTSEKNVLEKSGRLVVEPTLTLTRVTFRNTIAMVLLLSICICIKKQSRIVCKLNVCALLI